jgi:hypothetical protein
MGTRGREIKEKDIKRGTMRGHVLGSIFRGKEFFSGKNGKKVRNCCCCCFFSKKFDFLSR